MNNEGLILGNHVRIKNPDEEEQTNVLLESIFALNKARGYVVMTLGYQKDGISEGSVILYGDPKELVFKLCESLEKHPDVGMLYKAMQLLSMLRSAAGDNEE